MVLLVPAQFSTARLRAERMAAAHVAELRAMHTCEPMMAMIGGVRDEPGTLAYLERHLLHWEEHGFGFWMLYDAASGASAGLAGLRRLVLDGIDEVEVGYGFLPGFWGRGLGTEIAHACVAIGFGELGLPSLVALTKRENRASQDVLRKVGMLLDHEVTREGTSATIFRINRSGSAP